MASSIHIKNPNRNDWVDIYQKMDRGDLQGQIVYRIGVEILGTHNKREIPSNGEIITKQRIIEILDSEKSENPKLSLTSSSFDPILASRTKRGNYLQVVKNQPWVKDFDKFEKDLDELLQKQIVEQKDFKNSVRSFVDKFERKYPFFDVDFDPLFINRQDPHVREKLLNIVFHAHKNAQEIKDFIEEKKEEIIAAFAPDKFKNINAQQWDFTIQTKGQETHNEGHLPAKITFFYKDQEAFSVMHKPRGAAIDKAVLGLLAQCQMPVYKIISYDSEDKSVWQFIEGQDMVIPYKERRFIKHNGMRLKDTSTRAPEAFIRYSKDIKQEQRDGLLKQLEKLNRVLCTINITDLHGENIRLGKDGFIYPIDLEVMDDRQLTFLMIDDYYMSDIEERRKQALGQLSETEWSSIQKWHKSLIDEQRQYTVSFRHVLAGTGSLYQIRFATDFALAVEAMFNLITGGLGSRGYEFDETQKNIIKNQVTLDLLNGDVPFFTEYKNIIYYGPVNRNYAIGKRK